MADRTFAKFTFFKLDPAWQRRDPSERAEDKREFLAACEDFAEDRSVRAYSTVGTRGDVDLLILSQSPVLEDIHTFHVVLAQSGLARWASIPHSYLAQTKISPYSESQARPEICTSERKYLFVYPLDKKREWYRLPLSERRRVMAEHIEIGRSYPEITINTSYSFGIDDQEFVVSFEGDDAGPVPRPCAGAPRLGVERIHAARHADLHLRRDVRRQGAGRARRCRLRARALPRSRASPSGPRSDGGARQSGESSAGRDRRLGARPASTPPSTCSSVTTSTVEVDLYDKLPTPFGLVRAGVAPGPSEDQVGHPRLREDRGSRGLPFPRQRRDRQAHHRRRAGRALQRRDLRIRHGDRPKARNPRRGPARSVHAATDFVAWYNAHPDFADHEFDLAARRPW